MCRRACRHERPHASCWRAIERLPKGALDVETTPDEEMRLLKHRRYQKSATFDAFLSFDVALEEPEGALQ